MREFCLTMKLRNNRLIRLREELGLSAPRFAETAGVSYGDYISLESLKHSPLAKSGEWRETVLRIAEFHGVSPEWLFPDSVQEVVCPVVERELGAPELAQLMSPPDPHQLLEQAEIQGVVGECTREALTKFERNLLMRRHEGATLKELSESSKLSRERVRQIVAHAEGKTQKHLESQGYAKKSGWCVPPNPTEKGRLL